LLVVSIGERARVAADWRVPSRSDAGRLERAVAVLDDWLDAHDTGDGGLADDDAEELRRVGELAAAGAPEDELNRAVRAAREHGWGWRPLALLLGETPDRTRARLRDR
jgi:hypothetical protein